MSTIHELKTWPLEFQAMWDGRKTFDARPTKDRRFSERDLLHLREFDPCDTCSGRGFFVKKHETRRLPVFGRKKHPCAGCNGSKGVYTGRAMTAEVTYVLEGGKWGVEKGHVVMATKIKQRGAA